MYLEKGMREMGGNALCADAGAAIQTEDVLLRSLMKQTRIEEPLFEKGFHPVRK